MVRARFLSDNSFAWLYMGDVAFQSIGMNNNLEEGAYIEESLLQQCKVVSITSSVNECSYLLRRFLLSTIDC